MNTKALKTFIAGYDVKFLRWSPDFKRALLKTPDKAEFWLHADRSREKIIAQLTEAGVKPREANSPT